MLLVKSSETTELRMAFILGVQCLHPIYFGLRRIQNHNTFMNISPEKTTQFNGLLKCNCLLRYLCCQLTFVLLCLLYEVVGSKLYNSQRPEKNVSITARHSIICLNHLQFVLPKQYHKQLSLPYLQTFTEAIVRTISDDKLYIQVKVNMMDAHIRQQGDSYFKM